MKSTMEYVLFVMLFECLIDCAEMHVVYIWYVVQQERQFIWQLDDDRLLCYFPLYIEF